MSNLVIVANKVTLKRYCRQGFPKNNPLRMPLLSGLCGGYGKGRHQTNECRATRNIWGNPLAPGNSM